MKKIIFVLILLIIAFTEAFSQGKGFNSPNNYMGYRPEYKDTLIIDLDDGNKIEFIYTWHNLFRENDEITDKYFWKPFNTNLTLLSEKLNELKFENNNRYHITLKSWRDRTNITNRMKEFQLKYKLEGFKEKSKKERDSIAQMRLSQMWDFIAPRKHSLLVNVRKDITKTKEFQIENNKLISQTKWQHILEIEDVTCTVRLYTNKLDDLKKINSYNLKTLIRNEKDNFLKKQYYKFHTKLHYRIDDDKLVQQNPLSARRKVRTRHMSLNVYPMAGTSILKGELSADMGVLLGLNFNHKQNGAMRLGLRYQLKVFGSHKQTENLEMNTCSFVDGIVDFNLADDYKKENWIGAGVGYMIQRSGWSVYDDRTARIFIKYRSSKLWGVQPEFNYSFNKQEGFIGLGIFFSL